MATHNRVQNEGNGSRKSILAVALIVIVIALSAVWYMQVTAIDPDKKPPAAELDISQERLSSGWRTDLMAPDRTRWNSGDTGIYSLGIRNVHSSARTFHMNIYLEELGIDLEGTPVSSMAESTSNWFTYPESVPIGPDAIGMPTITMNIPQNTARGLYTFRIIVCETGDCVDTETSDSYSNTHLSLYVNG